MLKNATDSNSQHRRKEGLLPPMKEGAFIYRKCERRQECACLIRSQEERMPLVNGATAVIYKELPASRTQSQEHLFHSPRGYNWSPAREGC